ncbi:MAG: hypothetical protein KDD43_08760, partial [Bdellovibrionales bacterium]|nr:hypothetical protein [Bdellovibrionales bacterium]
MTGFAQIDGTAVDLSDSGSLLEAFEQCYPVLSLPELARLWSLVASNPLWKDSTVGLFRHYGFRWNHELEKTCQVLLNLPLEFQHWCSEKQLSPRDLAPVRAMAHPEEHMYLWECFLSSRLSKSQAVQALEWAVDLLLMGREWPEIKPALPNGDGKWLEMLKSLRFPRSEAVDSQKQGQMARLPWPSRTQGQWVRQGDRGVLEVRLQADSLDDFRKKLEGLEKVEKI